MNINQQLGLPCGIGPFYKQPSLFYHGVDSNINMLAKTRNMQWENSCGACGGYSNFTEAQVNRIIAIQEGKYIFSLGNPHTWLVKNGERIRWDKTRITPDVLKNIRVEVPLEVLEAIPEFDMGVLGMFMDSTNNKQKPEQKDKPNRPLMDRMNNKKDVAEEITATPPVETKPSLFSTKNISIGIGALALIGGALFLLRKK